MTSATGSGALAHRLDEGPLLADGAMGTMLYARGVPLDACFDVLNLHDRTVVGPASGVLPAVVLASGFSVDQGSERDTTPAGAWIGGNTWEHYDAHHGWIRELVARG